MKILALAFALAYAPVALAQPPSKPLNINEFCNGKGAEAAQSYRSGKDIEKQAPRIGGFIKNMRDGREPDNMGAVSVMSFAKGYCMGAFDGYQAGLRIGEKAEQRRNTF